MTEPIWQDYTTDNKKCQGRKTMTGEKCVMCGEVIPEGRQVCPICESKILSAHSEELTFLWKLFNKNEQSIRNAKKRNAPYADLAHLMHKQRMYLNIIDIVESDMRDEP